MYRSRLVVIVVLTFLVASAGSAARKVEDYSGTINDFKKSSDVAPFFDTAYGYAVFPSIGKAGLGIGGAHGKGQVYRDGEVVGFTSLSELSVGFQAGGQAYSQIVFFEDESALKNFTSGNFEFDASASAIVVRTSAGASASTEGSGAGASTGGSGGSHATAGYRKGMLIFVIGKGGLMYEATLGGQKYKFNPVE